MFDVQGFILVGGASSRMGTDKARLRFGELTSVELIANALSCITGSITTVGSPEQRLAALSNIPDLRPDWGPLAGIEAALRHAKSAHCVIVACDFPFVTGNLFARLLDSLNDADAIVPLQSDGRAQPLCAVYRVATCLTAAADAIAANEHAPRNLLDRVRTRYLPFGEVVHLTGSEHFFFNVNTPENYELALTLFHDVKRSSEK